MNEKPFFFPNGSYKLFGVLHEPKNDSTGEGFVFCHPFAEEKLWSHRVFVNFARALAKLGYTVLRFDYMGHGDSQGKFEEASIDTRLSDIHCAIHILKANFKNTLKINLLGLRLGSTLCALAAEADSSVNRLILWEPIINGDRYMREILRAHIVYQTAVYKEVRYNREALIKKLKMGESISIEGYEMKWTLFEKLTEIDLSLEKNKFGGETLIVQINPKEGIGINRVKMIAGRYNNPKIIPVVEQPFWKEIKEYYPFAKDLYKVTISWIKKNESLH